ncbi:tRNA N(3)-methylcytidine methyltransferase METTL2 [Scyliorhinus canicula]|uniref:tRNA N(3)-methylcytidine methyltransferase METTL2 n=1 Tax=Scyliorhinus canicula TaxID=7830 RepID=UPI0018F5D9CF|nr:tRNA N(3)-methylcytidine methyltransferase METTL2 [Scyliorhinus canicula]
MAALIEAESSPQRPQFGCRYLTDPGLVFQHNAWDNVEWSEEQEAAARKSVEENFTQLVSPEKQVEYENKANSYWNDFYKIHENKFFKDRHWLFTEFPELVSNCKPSSLDKTRPAPAVSSHSNAQSQGCLDRTVENGSHLSQMCAEEGVVCIQENNLKVDADSVWDGQGTDRLVALSSGVMPQMRNQLSEPELLDADYSGASGTFRILEVGCGVGNTVFPILQTNNDPGLFVYCCDFSSAAVELVKLNSGYERSRCLAFVHDLCDPQANYPMPNESLDIIILIFVLSAIHPDKMQAVVKRLSQLLKPGGMLLFRDYGRYDMAQLRFKKGRCLSENFYVRGDGTRVYFFTPGELDEFFTSANLEKVQNLVDRRLQVNRGKQLTMYRVWIQCKYRKPLQQGS